MSPASGALAYLLTGGALALSACGPQSALRCGAYSLASDTYAAHYQATPGETGIAAKNKPLGRRVYARATHYKMAAATPVAETCGDLVINKQLNLQRRDDPDFVFSEINQYYAADGELIATKVQDITDQLPQSGYYQAADELPIPQAAPPGKYRLVSKLLLTHKSTNKKFLLARTGAWIRISGGD